MVTYTTPFYKRSWFIVLVLALVFMIGVSIGTEDAEPKKDNHSKVVEKTPEPKPSVTPDIPKENVWDNAVKLVWGDLTEEERADICRLYILDSDYTLDIMVEGAGTEEAREPARKLFNEECLPTT